MKVDKLSALMRITAMLDWYQHSDGYKIPTRLTYTYYNTNSAELKESVQRLYDRYCESLGDAFGIKRMVSDLSEYSDENIVSLNAGINHPLWDFIENIAKDPSVIDTSSNSSLYNWEKFIRTISKIDIALMVNECALLYDFKGIMCNIPFAESIASLDFNTIAADMPHTFSKTMSLYTNRKSFSTRIDGIISVLTAYKAAYEKNGIDGIREVINEASISENLVGCDLEKLEGCDKEKLRSAMTAIQEPNHYRSLLKELFLDPVLDPPEVFVPDSKGSIARLERYYEIVDEIYHDTYLITSALYE